VEIAGGDVIGGRSAALTLGSLRPGLNRACKENPLEILLGWFLAG